MGKFHAGLIPEQAHNILRVLHDNGYAGVVAGGAVRDLHMAKVPKDVDILTNASIPALEALFAAWKIRTVGKSFPVCLINNIEVAVCRAGTKNFPEGDLGMRDFTINAMAYDPVEDVFYDPYNGVKDLENRVIRFVGNPDARIAEDPVRMIRGCRFAALFNARMADASRAAIQRHAASLIRQVPGERICRELIKAMAMKTPSSFFTLLHATGLLSEVLPCLDRCYGLDGGPFHGETVFDHCLLVGDALPAGQPLLRLAGYLHDTGKKDAQGIKQGRITFHGHETHTDVLEADLDRLRFSSAQKAYILSLIRCHMRPLARKTGPKSVRRLLAVLAANRLEFQDFMRLRIADKKANLAKSPYTLSDIRDRVKKVTDEFARQTALHPDDLAITGHQIMEISGLKPGPEVGRVKQHLFEQVLGDPGLNTKERLVQMVAAMDLG
ncbi:MAG TPA: CCA tRNA nucleotidyltransferase [Desulfotignum sp.]|nr:CCA tRNA nucleotidyltransferase [Desulfotignum sp.]